MHPIPRFTRSRPRLVAAFAFGLAIALLPWQRAPLTRALIGWNAAVWSYLGMMAWLMSHAGHERVRRIAEQEEESAVAVLVIMSIAAASSVAAIIFDLAAVRSAHGSLRLFQYALTGATVLGSWCLVAVIFTFHYALAFYQAAPGRTPLRFPDDEARPDYWDFLYFSITIAVAVQTSDVAVMTGAMRRLVLAQAVLSFLFNAAILGFSINIAAGLVGS